MSKVVLSLIGLIVFTALAYLVFTARFKEDEELKKFHEGLSKDTITILNCKLANITEHHYRHSWNKIFLNCPIKTLPLVLDRVVIDNISPETFNQTIRVSFLENNNCVLQISGFFDYEFGFNERYERYKFENRLFLDTNTCVPIKDLSP